MKDVRDDPWVHQEQVWDGKKEGERTERKRGRSRGKPEKRKELKECQGTLQQELRSSQVETCIAS